MKTKEERLLFLSENSVFFSRLGFGYDPPRLDENGRYIFFDKNFDKFIQEHRAFNEAGVKVHTFILPSGWLGDGEFDYKATDEILDAFFSALPTHYILPRIKLNAPIGWCKAHPEDVFVYDGGPDSAEEISSLVGGLRQDILGYESRVGYAVNGGTFRDDRPNVGGVIGLQSFSSARWVKDASEALERLLQHLESGKYADKIIGYHLAFGNCGETTLWGAWETDSARRGDFGITAAKCFKTYDDRGVPSAIERYSTKNTLASFFRKDEIGKRAVKYDTFINDTTARAISALCKAAKHVAPEKAVGVFYGYLLNVPNSAYAGHLAIDALLQEDSLDFISSPKGYYFCGADGPGLEQAPTQSIARKKLWLDEIDNLTHVDTRSNPTKPKNAEETHAVLCREFAKNIAAGQGYWWMDLGDGSFCDPDIMHDIKRMTAFAKSLPPKQRTQAEVLFVIDDEAFLYHAPSYTLHRAFIQHLPSLIKQCGVLCDLYRVKDLETLDLSCYKLIVFLNAYTVTETFATALRKKTPSNTLFLWCYAPGAASRTDPTDGVRRVTGMTVRERTHVADAEFTALSVPRHLENDFPFLEILPNDRAEILLQDGDAVIGARLENDILITHPRFDRGFLRSLLTRAGVHFYAPEGCTVYGDERFLYVIANEEANGIIRFPSPVTVKNVFNGERFENVTEITLVTTGKRGFLFSLSKV